MAAAHRTAGRRYPNTTPSSMRWQNLPAAHFKSSSMLLTMVIPCRRTVLRGAYKLRFPARLAELTLQHDASRQQDGRHRPPENGPTS